MQYYAMTRQVALAHPYGVTRCVCMSHYARQVSNHYTLHAPVMLLLSHCKEGWAQPL